MNRMLVEILMVRVILMRSHMKRNNKLLENWRKDNPCYKVVKKLADLCSCSNFLGKVDFVGNEIGYLAEENSQLSVKRMS